MATLTESPKLQVTLQSIAHLQTAWLPPNIYIPLYDLHSLLIDIPTFNEPRSVDNVQGESCPGA